MPVTDPRSLAASQCLRGALGEDSANGMPRLDLDPWSPSPDRGSAGVRQALQPTPTAPGPSPWRACAQRQHCRHSPIVPDRSSRRTGRPHSQVPSARRVARPRWAPIGSPTHFASQRTGNPLPIGELRQARTTPHRSRSRWPPLADLSLRRVEPNPNQICISVPSRRSRTVALSAPI